MLHQVEADDLFFTDRPGAGKEAPVCSTNSQ